MSEKIDGMSMDIEATNLEKLKSLFPECVSEGKLDIDKLLSLCGEYIDNDFERYKFEWKGKAECLRLAQKRSTGTLRPCESESAGKDGTPGKFDSDNLYIEGDNLEVLKLLQTAYYRKVKMIYIDPPYNTGNDFVYEDDFADPINRYKEVTAQTTKSNPETMGRYHTNWLNMMYPRLRLAANLLRDDGVIFISIDDNEVDNLKKLCNEVFGEENFVACIIWERAYSPVNLKKQFSENHDYCLVYAKCLNNLICYGLNRTEEANDRYLNPDNDARGVWKSSDLSVGPIVESNVYEITTPSGRKVLPPEGYCWILSKSKFEEYAKDNRIWFGSDGNNVPSIKRFLNEVKQGITPMTVWKYVDVGHSQEATKKLKELFDGGAFFEYPKSVKLVKRMLVLYTKNEDTVLDFFSGSATTAHAVMQLNAEDGGNRKFIMVQLPEVCDEKSEAYKAGYKNICEIGKERIRRAGAKIRADKPDANPTFDTGFKVFKLDTSNLVMWDSAPIENHDIMTLLNRLNAMTSSMKPDRTDMDVVAEIMLKMGVPLDIPVTKIDVNGKEAYAVDDYLLLICLADNVTAEDMEKLCDLAPGKLVIAESSFADTSAMRNANYIVRDRNVSLKLI